jgi:hypothetical protein
VECGLVLMLDDDALVLMLDDDADIYEKRSKKSEAKSAAKQRAKQRAKVCGINTNTTTTGGDK